MSYPWALVIVFVVSYFVGSINITKIISRLLWHENIEKEGSGNPGTMNMIRTHGALAGFATLLLEVVKAGLTAWLCRYLTAGYGSGELVFYFSGLALVIGSCFPFFGTVKGGKGIAVIGGVYLFSNLWYVGLALFFVGVVQIVLTEYGFISSLIFVLGMTIATTVYIFVCPVAGAPLICLLVWLMLALVFARHYKNFYRLFTHTENKAGFKKAFAKLFKKGQTQTEAQEQPKQPESTDNADTATASQPPQPQPQKRTKKQR